MDITQLQVFISVYTNRSFSAASRELHLTQPAVSMHVKRLEEELGVRLFDRVGRKTIPTKEGTLLYQRAEEIMEKLDDIKVDLGVAEKEIKGLISIGANGIAGSYIIPQLAAEFKKLHRDVFFQVVIEHTAKILEMISGGELMLAIVDEKKDIGNLDCLYSIEDELVLVAAPGFVKKKKITPLGLVKLPLLIREDTSDARRSMEKQHLLHKISLGALNITAIMGSTDSLKEAVKAGLGASILSRFAVKDDLKSGLMEEIKITGVRMRRTLYVVAHKKRVLPEHYRKFVEFIAEKLPVKK